MAAKETDDGDLGGSAAGPADSYAAEIALDAAKTDPAMAARVAALIDEQTKFLRLQAHEVVREDAIRHRSLRVRHIADLLRVAFALAVAFIVALIAVGLAAAVWSASQDDGLVIEAFSVPPDLAQRGLTGQVVAGQMLDKLAHLQTATDSNRPARSYANNWGNDIKVQIPDTGVSVGEAYRFLSQWLGHQTHISGEVFRDEGGLAVTARVAGEEGATVRGPESDLDTLEQKAAEQVYARTQPYRYAVYEFGKGNIAEARRVFQSLIAGNSPIDHAWAELGLGSAEEDKLPGDEHEAERLYRAAAAEEPELTLARNDLADVESTLGHDEAWLSAVRATLDLIDRGLAVNPRCAAVAEPLNRGRIAGALGDYATAARYYAEAAGSAGCAANADAAQTILPAALALGHDEAAARAAWNAVAASPPGAGLGSIGAPEAMQWRATAALLLNFALYDWNGVLKAQAANEKNAAVLGASGAMTNRTLGVAAAALARAHLGDVAGGQAMIAATPVDCYFCVRARAQLAALAGQWNVSARWYALATKLAPSLPVAWSEWGQMLLTRGDTDGAIAKFETAHALGPHFADPLELWGEALMRENRSDLALAKFTEAAQYAPHWARLHRKWGEALLYTGDKNGAKAQFALAAALQPAP